MLLEHADECFRRGSQWHCIPRQHAERDRDLGMGERHGGQLFRAVEVDGQSGQDLQAEAGATRLTAATPC